MAIFKSKFFTKAGQKERIQNVGATLKAALTGKGVQSNTGNKTADKILSAAASNPYTTAAVAAVAINPTGAINAAKTTISSLSSKQKVAAAIIAPVAISVAATNPKKTAKTIAETPAKLAEFGGNVAELAQDPSIDNLKKVAKDNPVITGAVLATGAYVAGRAVTGAAANLTNTLATKENTKALGELQTLQTTAGAALALPSSSSVSDMPLTPQTQIIGKEVGSARKYKSSPRKSSYGASQSLHVTINNQNKNTKFIKMSRY